MAARACLVISFALAAEIASAPAAAEVPSTPAPANDGLAGAQAIQSLPATVQGTTVGATIEPAENEFDCGVQTSSSVWYRVRPSTAERIAVDLAAGGALDGTIHVFYVGRSPLTAVGCQQADSP